uniref:G-protein coupled receptors family 1 profile domain-containing protein n=1 Tax=Timema douglasi TaxID=61478 RepID=A0A7R8VRF8_TIMDO|nr:unnamed protein product [Timema douglasi]
MFTDLTVGLISVLTDIIWRITVTWHAGNLACKFIRFAQALVTYSSTYVLVALSIDRYDAITHPMNFSGSWRRARVLVATAWVLSALFSIPIIILYEEKYVQGKLQCWIDFPEPWQWQLYMTSVAVALFIIPAVIISACYTVIVVTIWSKSKVLTPTGRPRVSNRTNMCKEINDVLENTLSRKAIQDGGVDFDMAIKSSQVHGLAEMVKCYNRTLQIRYNLLFDEVSVVPDDHRALRNIPDDQDSRRASSRGIIPRAKIKTVKMTFVIVFVFVLCWSPYIVFDLLQVYGHVPSTQTNIAVATFIQSLAPLNSAANPVIYCLFSTHICRALRQDLHYHNIDLPIPVPPFSWVTSLLSVCFPSLRAGDGQCLRYGGDTSSTVTETLTQQSSRRSAAASVHMATSLRHHHMTIKAPSATGKCGHTAMSTV